jgi:hypothetical protein
MKKYLILSLFIIFISEGIFSNSLPINDEINSGNVNSFKLDLTSPEDQLKIDTNLKITHAVFAGITYASLWALDGIGAALLYYVFTNPSSEVYKPLLYSHIAIAVSALLSFATVITLAFTKIGIKVQNHLSIRTSHLTAAIVTLSFYLLELTTIIMSAVFFSTKNENAKWVGLAHGITCGATTLAFSVSLITIFF